MGESPKELFLAGVKRGWKNAVQGISLEETLAAAGVTWDQWENR